ncbi:MAG: protein kinase [Planctomycetes bacterium]|nr:protein kinase [Planctomycetota bacterium]
MPRDAEPVLVELVTKALEQRAAGGNPRLDEICAEHPELRRAVAEAIGIAEALPIELGDAGRDDLRGRVLAGRYRCGPRLGRGSMGVVHSAFDLELGREVAVKVLRGGSIGSERDEQRFVRESEVLASIRHRAVVTIHDRGRTDDGELFFVMALLEGAPLSAVVDAAARVVDRFGAERLDRLDWLAELLGTGQAAERGSYLRMVVGWIADLAGGLQAAHDTGVLHRDLKPSNAFLGRDGTPVLLDFGIAARTAEATADCGTGTIGTAAYLAPEQIDGAEPSIAADVYGLAATLYHLVTLRLPYNGSPAQIRKLVRRRNPPRPRSVRPDLPRDLEAILERGMARDPAQRYPTAAALAADLQAFLAHRPIVARPVSWPVRLLRRSLRSPTVRGGAAVACLAAVALAAVAWHGAARAERRELWSETWAHVPPSLGLWVDRELPTERRQVAAALLDRAAELCVESVPTLVVRAAFRWDHGDREGALADLATVAAEVASPLAIEIARRHRLAAGTAVPADALPEPRDDRDRFLAAWHQLRANDAAAAQATLVGGGATFAPARELHLVLVVPTVRQQADHARGLEVARAAYEDAVRLEAQIGRRTATTAHILVGALIGQGRYAEALPIVEAGIALSTPAFHGLLTNRGILERRLGDPERAIASCEAALALSARAATAHETLVVAHVDLGDLDGARAALQRAIVPPKTRTGLEARIAFLEARTAWRAGDRSAARTAAQRAVELSQQLKDRRETAHELAYCSAIVDGRDPFLAALTAATHDVSDPWLVRKLVLPELPQQLDPAQTVQLRRFFETWCAHQSNAPR